MLLYIAIFFLVNILLSSYFIDIWPTPNCVSRALPVLAFSEDRTLKIDKYADLTIDKSKVGEHFYSDKAPLPTLCMIPLYELIKLCGLDKVSDDAGRKYPVYIGYHVGVDDSRDYSIPKLIPIFIVGGFIFGSLPFVLIVMMSFMALHKMKPSLSPVLMAMLAWYGSFIFVFSGTFFNHVFAGCLLLLSFISIKRNYYFLSGLTLGLSFLSEYTVIIAAPFWFICVWIKEKKISHPLIFVLGILPSILFIALYNWLITGSPWQMLNAYHASLAFQALQHNYGFSLPSLKAIWGLSFSGWMGLFNFAPVLYCIAFYIILMLIKNKKMLLPLETNCLALFGIMFFLVISSFFTWWGGWSYGPRYLIVLAVLLLYEGMLVISRDKINILLFTVTALFGITGAWVAKATVVYMVPFPEYDGFFNPFLHVLLPDLFAGRFNANNALTAFFDVSPQTGVYGWLILYVISLSGLCMLYKKWFAEKIVRQ
ncbi:MAG: hypothetical protein NTW65_09610 [Deltaproteobacteria bacterium]|nr:hypothetical protein [Deltaproteobacteria bacterium]